MTRLHARIVSTRGLCATDHQRMFAVFSEYYASVSFERFLSDLSTKDDVILLLDERQSIQGFSTLKSLAIKVHGKPIHGLFSGDTVVTKAHWGQRVLGRAFLRYLLLQKLRNPLVPYYWFLISKGYKTYLLMANNFEDCHPRLEAEMTSWDKAVLDGFATTLYPDAYDGSTGLITFAESHGHVRSGIADITPELCDQIPRVNFFAARNPTWFEGSELACIARMTWSMPLKYALKAQLRSWEAGLKQHAQPTPAGRGALSTGGVS